MFEMTESRITIEVPSNSDMETLAKNFTLLVTEIEETIMRGDPIRDERLVTDVWVGIVLTLLVLICSVSMCSCLVFSRYQVWKRRVMRERARSAGGEGAEESLPSYTIVSGLPTYDEALEQLKKVKQAQLGTGDWIPRPPPSPPARLSVVDLFQLYKESAPAQTQPASPPPTVTPAADIPVELPAENKS